MSMLCRRLICNNSGLLHQLTSKCRTNIRYNTSYDGDGKTKVKVLNNDFEMGLMINSFSEVILIKYYVLRHTYIYVLCSSFRTDFD